MHVLFFYGKIIIEIRKKVGDTLAKSKADEWLSQDKLILLEAWARDGLTDEQIANNMGISVASLYNYKNKYLEILEALKKGKEVVDIEVENALLKSAKGFWYDEEVVSTKKEVIYQDGKRVKEISEPVIITLNKYKPSETAAAIFWLKNRKSDKWRDKIEINKQSNDVNTQIQNIANLLNNPQPNRSEKDVQ